MIHALARHIFEHGIEGRFYSQAYSITTKGERSTGAWPRRLRQRP